MAPAERRGSKMMKWVKRGLITATCLAVVGGGVFGKDLVSYVRSSARTVRTAVKDSVPLEFEFKRARDLLDEIIPEMHANIRLIAQEEVEIAALKGEISRAEEELAEQQLKIKKVREELGNQRDTYRLGGRTFTPEELRQRLARWFEQYKEAELGLEGKRRLLAGREKSLHAATSLLERTRERKRQLAQKIETLESQYRLVKASAVGTRVRIDGGKLHQTERLIGDIKKRLDIAERVLAHEHSFVDEIEIEVVSEKELLAEVDAHFACSEARDAAER